MKILFYTFNVWNNTSFRIAQLLREKGKEVFLLPPRFSLKNKISFPADTYFIGFGDYMRTAKRLRLETSAQNVFQRQAIIPGGSLETPLFHDFELPQTIFLSSVKNTGPCNRAAYFFAQQYGQEKSVFVHVPKKYDINLGKEALQNLEAQWFSLIQNSA